MNDINKIEEFLTLIKLIAKEYDINKHLVYGNLVYYGDDPEYIKDLFPNWISEFEKEKNIKVYIPANWPDFCQFKSKQIDHLPNNKIKIYIPLDKEHINEGVKRIFHYLTKINAVHISKVAQSIRYDDIVIRVNSIDTAKKIGDFVAKDEYIKDGLLGTNPFAYNDGNISYTWDGEVSYNIVVATYITDYINTLKHNNRLDEVSYKSFITYLKDIYKEVFIENNNVDLYKELMEIEDYNLSNEDVKKSLLNYQIITKILLNALMPNKNLEEFYTEYQRIITSGNNLYDYIYHSLIQKYHNYHHVDEIIFNYLLDNNPKHFTKHAKGINIRKIIQLQSLTNKKIQTMMLTSENRINLRKMLYIITSNTIITYNENRALKALKAYRKYKNTNYFSINNIFKKRFIENIHPQELMGIIRETLIAEGYNLEEIPQNEIDLYNEYIELIKNYLHNKVK